MSIFSSSLQPTVRYNIKKLYRALKLESEPVDVKIRNNPRNRSYINWTLVRWREQYPESELFAKEYSTMADYERLEILRLMVLSMKMSIYTSADSYNIRVVAKLSRRQAENIDALYPENFKLLSFFTSSKQKTRPIDFYIVNDGLAKNIYWSDFLFNANTLYMLNYRQISPPGTGLNFDNKVLDLMTNAMNAESTFQSYGYYYTGSNILQYLNLRPARDFDIGKLETSPTFTIPDASIKLEIQDLTGDQPFAKELTGVAYSQTIYSPKLWFLYNGIKYHMLPIYIYKKFARSNVKSYADLLTISYFTGLPIAYPKLPETFTLVGSANPEGRFRSNIIAREKFIELVYKYILKLYNISDNSTVKNYVREKIIHGGDANAPNN